MRARALIVDDEAPAREELRYLLDEFEGVQVVGEATNVEEALVLLRSLTYDVVLLDIRMPGGTGLDIAKALRELEQRPKVIFTTAYPDYAVAAFDLEAVDYLVKPFDAERLRRALDRALSGASDDADGGSTGRRPGSPQVGTLGGPGGGAEPLGRIPVQRDGRTVLVDEASIIYASAARGYAYLQLAEERVLVSFSLNELERRLHGHFFRTHRSYLVNLDHVRELVPDFKGGLALVMDDRQRSRVEVSRRQARELRRALGM
ncbi:MAG TPA: LytTR family DNA-binding domain-containing protein [Jiangellaceae bacterium]